MHRDHKVKEARRRARKFAARTVTVTTGVKIIPDRRAKLLKRAVRRDPD